MKNMSSNSIDDLKELDDVEEEFTEQESKMKARTNITMMFVL